MDSPSTGLIIALILLIFLSAYFSATETAFSALNRIRLKTLADEGNRRARLAYQLSEHYDELISTILVGNNIVNIAATSLATLLFISMFGDNGPTLSTIVMTLLVLVFGEVTPKSLAKESPERFAMLSAPVIRVLNYLFKPLTVCLTAIQHLTGKLIKSSPDRSFSESELLSLVEEVEQGGGINENESALIHSVIEFDDREAADILTPRVDVEAIEKGATIAEIQQLFMETEFSRLPVYDETIDNVIGVINEKDFHNGVLHKGKTPEEILQPVEYVPASMKIPALLKLLQNRRSHLAVVVDEFGGTEGIVTMEDILEELIGDIWDEHDQISESIRKISDTEYLVDCGEDLEKLIAFFHLPEDEENEELNTVNGWVTAHLDRIPVKGDSFVLENLQITVEETDAQRAATVRITLLPQPEPAAEEA